MGAFVGAAVGLIVGQLAHAEGAGVVGAGVGAYEGLPALALRVMVPLDLYTVLYPVAHSTAMVTDPEDGISIDVLVQLHFLRFEQEPPDMLPAVDVNTH